MRNGKKFRKRLNGPANTNLISKDLGTDGKLGKRIEKSRTTVSQVTKVYCKLERHTLTVFLPQ